MNMFDSTNSTLAPSVDIFTTAFATGSIVAFIAILIITLNIVLFFKIWNMTNDVAKIREILEEINLPEASLDDDNIAGAKRSEFWRIDKVPFRRERSFPEPNDKDSNK